MARRSAPTYAKETRAPAGGGERPDCPSSSSPLPRRSVVEGSDHDNPCASQAAFEGLRGSGRTWNTLGQMQPAEHPVSEILAEKGRNVLRIDAGAPTLEA